MQSSNPTLYTDNFRFLGKILLKFNYFPRGKVKAPKHVKPPEVVLKADIIKQLITSKEHITVIINLYKDAYFVHPIFGNVNTLRVFSFLNAHTNHHLKIIKAIM
ncbi:hypothetical protein [Polaribacter atrinae]|uniref:hypothetical protein n=1 Tax=Polaribacter atrinae TaxID=1333662 RepID=UPI003CD0C8C5